MTASLTSSIWRFCCVSALVLLIRPLNAAGDLAPGDSSAGTAIAALPPSSPATGLAPRGADDRVPLSVAGSKVGAIVLVTGADVHITRPDGTEAKIHGARPEAVADIRNRDAVAVVHDGEAWVRPKDLAALLGALPQSDQQPGAASTQSAAAFETFRVQKPTVAPPVEAPRPPARRARPTSLQVRSSAESVSPEVTPVPMNLDFSRMLILSGQDTRGFYLEGFGAPRHSLDDRSREIDPGSPFSRRISYLSLDMGDESRRYEIGDMFDPLFGAATGIGFSSALSGRTRAGASLVLAAVPVGERSDGELALRTETLVAKYLTAEAAVATDGGHYTSARWERPEFSVRTSLLQAHDDQRQDLWWRLKALPALSFFGRSSALKGDFDASTSAFGLSWDARQVHAALERNTGEASGKPWAQDSLSLSFLRKNLTGIVRYLANREEGGRAGLEWSISRPGRRGYVSVRSSAPQPSPGDKRTYRLGATTELKRRLRARAAFARESSGVRPELSIEYRPSHDQVMSVSYGGFDTGTPNAGLVNALVVQAAASFGGPGRSRAGIAEITGKVADDAGQGVADVAVVLDGADVALTKADGGYTFLGLETGRHSVRLDPDRIPADYEGAATVRVAYAAAQEPGRADFSLTRLCQISGAVYVESSATHQREGLAGVAVELGTGARTTTDSQGRYAFGGLKPGSHTVSASFDGGAQGVTPTPPTSWSFRLRPGEKASGADFGFLRRDRPVVFGQLGEG